MPILWQSSQRPMYVRTVWVDGFRHAILSHDDPYFLKLNARKRRPNSSATCSASTRARSSRSHAEVERINSFNFVVRNDRTLRPYSSHEPDIEKLNLTDVEDYTDDEKESQHENNYTNIRNAYHNMKAIKTNRTGRQEPKENTELSDRVLQWLDLAGKVDLLLPDNTERMTQPRHSWPEIQRRNEITKSKTTTDIKETGKLPSPKIVDTPKAPQSGNIDRHEFYEPTSANTIETYARQSRHARTKHEMKTKDNHKTKKELKTNIQETRLKVASERAAIEKQYAELLNKKMIPDLKPSKKQVHIFMPEVPKKGTSETTSRTESLLSQFSQMTQKAKLNKA